MNSDEEADESVETTAKLYTWPMEEALVIGIILFSVGTILVAYGERIVRKLIIKRLEKLEAALPPESSIEPSVQDSGIWQEPVRPK